MGEGDAEDGKRVVSADTSLEPSMQLYGTAFLITFTQTISWSFLPQYAAVIKTPPALMGVLTSSRNLFQNVLQFLWGGLTRLWGKRIFVFLGYVISSLFIVSFILTRDPLQFLFLVIFQSIAWSIAIPAWNALLGDYTRIEVRGGLLGKIGALGAISSVVSTLIVAVTTYSSGAETTPLSFTVPFVLSAASGIFGAVLVTLVEELKVENGSKSMGKMFSSLRDKPFAVFLTTNTIFWFAAAFAWPLIPYVTIDIVHASVWQIALIATFSGLADTITRPIIGSLIDRFGRRPVLIAGQLTFFLFPLGYAFSTSWFHLLAINMLFSPVRSALMVITTTYALDSAPEGERASYIAAYNTFLGITTCVGSLLGGFFTSLMSVSIGFEKAVFTGLLVSVVMRIITSLGAFKVKETLKK